MKGWTKTDSIDGVANSYHRPPQYRMFTRRLIEKEEDRPEAWNASFRSDHAVGEIEVWTYGSEQDVMELCEKLVRTAGWM